MLILASTVTGCVSISAFPSLACVPIGIASSAVGLKIFAVTAEIKKYKSIIKKKKKKYEEIVLLGKTKLNTLEILISKALVDSCISHDEFVSVINVLRKYNEVKEEIKKSWNFCGTHYINMVDISRETYERNGIETIADNDGISWLNEKKNRRRIRS